MKVAEINWLAVQSEALPLDDSPPSSRTKPGLPLGRAILRIQDVRGLI